MAPRADPGAVSERPLEEHLQQNSLWPEIFKVYGHGNDLFALAADPLGRCLASSCRSQTKEFAAIWIWKVDTWAPLQQLEAHTLTATQLAFTPDGAFLVSVSRDRSLAVWVRTEDEQQPFQLLGRILKAHARIVWSVSCASDASCFATGSRDNAVKLWLFGSQGQGLPQKAIWTSKAYPSSVQSLAFSPSTTCLKEGEHLLAVGLEDGAIEILKLNLSGQAGGKEVDVQVAWRAPVHQEHSGAVRRLSWQDKQHEDGHLLLGSCSDDHAVHVYQVNFP